jgi:hypothetical protein
MRHMPPILSYRRDIVLGSEFFVSGDRLVPPFYRRLEFFKLLTGHGLPYFLITER